MRRSVIILISCLASWSARADMMPDIANAGPPATGGCTAATNYLARTTGGNEGGNAANITTLICGLVTDGVITGNLSGTIGGCGTFLDTLYVLAQQNATDAKLNLCGTTYGATAVGTGGTFTTLQGFSGFSASNYLDTGFNPSTATTPKFVQNSANFGLWAYADVSENLPAFGNGVTGATGESHIYDDFAGNLFYARVNSPNAGSVPNPGTKGLYVGERISSATHCSLLERRGAGFSVGYISSAKIRYFQYRQYQRLCWPNLRNPLRGPYRRPDGCVAKPRLL